MSGHARQCAVCGGTVDRTINGILLCGGCVPPRSTPLDVHQEQGPTRRSELRFPGAVVPGPGPGPGPGVHPKRSVLREEHLLYQLIVAYEAGELSPEPVRLGPLPSRARRLMRAAAADMALLMGLRLAVDEDRPLPYASRLAAERLGLGDDKARAHRVIRSLVRAGVVIEAGALAGRKGLDGMKLYAPPGAQFVGDTFVVEACAGDVGQLAQPEPEVVDEPLVVRAELAVSGAPAGTAACATRGEPPEIHRTSVPAKPAAQNVPVTGPADDRPTGGSARPTPRDRPSRLLTHDELVERLKREFDAVEIEPDPHPRALP